MTEPCADMPSPTQLLSQRLQTIALAGIVAACRALGPVPSSNLGGWMARGIGPLLRASRVAEANLRLSLPELDQAARTRIIGAAWDNLGRTSAELPHLASFLRTDAGPGWEVAGEQHLAPARRAGGQALFFSGHLGNWEMVLPIAAGLGMTVAGFYRAASNRGIDDAVQSMRRAALGPRVSMFAKGAHGARGALSHLREGGSLGMLVDQKMNDGISVPFFGREAMTAPALAQLALRFDLPILPVHVVRLEPGRFRMVCDAPLPVERSGDRARDVQAISRAMNLTLERWIRADPGAWLWMHRRWPRTSPAPT